MFISWEADQFPSRFSFVVKKTKFPSKFQNFPHTPTFHGKELPNFHIFSHHVKNVIYQSSQKLFDRSWNFHLLFRADYYPLK